MPLPPPTCRAPLLTTCALFLAASASAQTGSTLRLSLTPSGAQTNATSSSADLSADGRFVVFESLASNLVPGDVNGTQSLFLLDRRSGSVEMISVDATGGPGSQYSSEVRISADGRTAVFTSDAPNLVPGDVNGWSDVFLRDLVSGQTRRLSQDSTGAGGNFPSGNPSVSDDGQWVVFQSAATNLVPGDSNGATDIFLYDRASDSLSFVSLDNAGNLVDRSCQQPAISGDGSRVAFSTLASNLDPADTNETWDVYVRDLALGTTTIASLDSSGQPGDWWSYLPEISRDGRRVVFQSLSALMPGDLNDDTDVYLRDLVSGQLELVSVAMAGGAGAAASYHPTIDAAGDLVAFDSMAADLVPGDTNGTRDVFVRDLTLGTTERVSVATDGSQGNGLSVTGVISADGRQVLFRGAATNLVPGDTNGFDDVFVRDRAGCSATVAGYCTPSTTSVAGCEVTLTASGSPSLSAPSAFGVRTATMLGGVHGIAYLGDTGPAARPFGTQGGLMCVAPPLWRAALKGSGGSAGRCDGQLDYTLQELVSASGGHIAAGDTVHVALWFRDPGSPDGFGLSSGLWFQVCP